MHFHPTYCMLEYPAYTHHHKIWNKASQTWGIFNPVKKEHDIMKVQYLDENK